MGTERNSRSIVEDWIEAWNCKDLDRTMRHYASSVVFEANTVVRAGTDQTAFCAARTSSTTTFAWGWTLFPRSTLSWRSRSPPARIIELIKHPKAMQAMMRMKKLDIAELERAAQS